MGLSAIFTIWLREIKRFMRDRSRLIGNFIQPFIWFAIMGIGLGSSIVLPGHENYLTFISPGIIGMSLLFTSVFSGISVIWDRQFGFLKEILVAPISRSNIVMGKILGSCTTSLVSATIVLIMAVALGGIPLSDLSLVSVLIAYVFMILIAFSFVSLGLTIAAAINSLEGFQLLINFIILPLFFLSGAFFPMTNVPIWMKTIAHVDPLMYGVDGLRGMLIGASQYSPLLDMGVLAGFSIVMITVSTFMFRRMG